MKHAFLAFSLIATSLFAEQTAASRVYVDAAGGYSIIDGAIKDDGHVAQARLAFGYDLYTWKPFTVSVEAGVQSGNTMRLRASQAVLDVVAPPLEATLKPFVDFLVPARVQLEDDFFLFIKGGIAYRQLQFADRISSCDHIERINAEAQAGLAYYFTPKARIMAYYQGIYSGHNARITLDSNNLPRLGQIPTQQGGFLCIEWGF